MNLIAYGSLMHPAEFAALDPEAAIPVWVRGYRRAFDQTPMWRGDGNPIHSVLAVRHDSVACFNGILLLGIAARWSPTLDHRERGYIRTPLAKQSIELFVNPREVEPSSNASTARGELLSQECEVYVGRSEHQNQTGAPLADYHTLCREASAAWGEPFARAFEQTTH